MHLAVVQFSDLHISCKNHGLEDLPTRIRAAVDSVCPSPDSLVLCNVGDLTDSGAKREFEVGARLVRDCINELSRGRPQLRVLELHTPGNHDCLLPEDEIEERAQLVSIATRTMPKGRVLDNTLVHQEEFFAFLAQRYHKKKFASEHRLAYTAVEKLNDYSIQLTSINSAWLTQRKETKDMAIAIDRLPKRSPSAMLHLVAMHHPIGWLRQTDQRALRNYLKENVDVMMCGHEHEMDSSKVSDLDGSNPYAVFDGGYIESDKQRQLFIHVANTDTGVVTSSRFDLSGSSKAIELPAFTLVTGRRTAPLQMSSEYSKGLQMHRTPLRHPRAANLTVDNLFIDRELEIAGSDTNRKLSVPTTVSALAALAISGAAGTKVVSGDDKSGKTMLCHRAFLDGYAAGACPILLNGQELGSANLPNLRKLMELRVTECYGCSLLDWLEIPAGARAIFIDDWHKSTLSPARKQEVLKVLRSWAVEVILLTGEECDFALIAESCPGEHHDSLTVYSILELSRTAKIALLHSWRLLGDEDHLDAGTYARQVSETYAFVMNVIGKNLLPHYPMFILTIVQAWENDHSAQDSNLGSYGFHCELLVKLYIARIGDVLRRKKVGLRSDSLMNLLGYVAMETGHESDAPSLGIDQFRAIVGEYCRRYDAQISVADLLDILLEANILRRDFASQYSFSYPLLRYYFVAFYLSERHRAGEVEAVHSHLDKLLSALHVSSNVWMCTIYAYMTKDPAFLSKAVASAGGLFGDFSECDLAVDMAEFVKGTDALADPRKTAPVSEVAIGDGNGESAAEIMDRTEHPGDDDTIALQEQFAEILSARKGIQMLGQIVRNHAGSLEGPQKEEIIRSALNLGLRLLKVMRNLFIDYEDEIVKALDDLMDESRGDKPRETLAERVRRAGSIDDGKTLFRSFVVIQMLQEVLRLVRAIGSEELTLTYKKIFDPNNVSHNLIDIGIAAFHYEEFPVKKALEKAEQWKPQASHRFPYFVLRLMVVRHVQMFGCDYKTFGKLAATFDLPQSLELKSLQARLSARD